MVYKVQCSNCGKILDFGGRNPEESHSGEDPIPENGIKFDGSIYCRECVKELIEFGAEDLYSRLETVEKQLNV